VAAAADRPGVAVAASVDTSPRSVDIVGIRLDVLSAGQARAWLRGALADPWDGHCRHVVTLNPEYVMSARIDSRFEQAIRCADLVTADGIGVVAAARLIHGARVTRVTGVELVEELAKLSGEENAPLFMLGAGSGVADDAIRRLQEHQPGMQTAGVWAAGTPAPEHDSPAIERIESGRARSVVVAYGAPGQVLWIDRNRDRLASSGVRLAVGVGGALDYLSGGIERPPEVVRKFGLEWLVRLAREPRRWRRQAVLPIFAVRVLIEAVRVRAGSLANRR